MDSSSPIYERRRAARFDLQFPVETTRVGGEPVSVKGVTENVSSRGVLFTSPAPIPVGKAIEFVIEMPDGIGTGLVLRCAGNIVRTEMRGVEAAAVAATIERHQYTRS